MKVYQIVSETENTNEAPQNWMKGKALGIASRFSNRAQGAKEVGDEANELKKQLSRYMGAKRIPRGQLTTDQLDDFLRLTGYSTDSRSVLNDIQAKQQKKDQDRQAKIRKAGQTVGAIGSAAKAGAQAAKDTYNKRKPSESISEDDTDFLTNQQIDKILLQVVSQSFGQGGSEIQRGKYTSRSNTQSATSKQSGDKIDNFVKSLTPDEKKKLLAALGVDNKPAQPKQKGDIAKGPDGDDYVWLGAAWKNKRTGKIARKEIANRLPK